MQPTPYDSVLRTPRPLSGEASVRRWQGSYGRCERTLLRRLPQRVRSILDLSRNTPVKLLNDSHWDLDLPRETHSQVYNRTRAIPVAQYLFRPPNLDSVPDPVLWSKVEQPPRLEMLDDVSFRAVE